MSVEVQKAHAKTLSKEKLGLYIRSIHNSTLCHKDRTELLDFCEERYRRLNLNNALIEKPDMSDFDGFNV